MLDEGRLKYVWTKKAEEFYQVILKFDTIDWRKNKEHSFSGYNWAYYALIDGVPHRYPEDGQKLNTHPEGYVLKALLRKLKEKESELPEIPKGWNKQWWKRTSWEVNDD